MANSLGCNPNGLPAVSDLDLDVAEGELMVLVGPSGSGKTTALRMVAGLEDITSGTLRMGSKAVNDLPPKDRNVAMVFQNYAVNDDRKRQHLNTGTR